MRSLTSIIARLPILGVMHCKNRFLGRGIYLEFKLMRCARRVRRFPGIVHENALNRALSKTARTACHQHGAQDDEHHSRHFGMNHRLEAPPRG